MNKEFLKRMICFVSDAGDIALELIENSQPALKKDNSIVTNADKAISDLARIHLADLLKTKKHILIEEEDAHVATYLDQDLLEQSAYVWSIDPIDGTRNYANNIPLYGISIGVLKDLQPWMGVVYFPAAKEMFYCDGQEAFFVKNAFSEDEIRVPIVPIDQNITKQSILILRDDFSRDFDWDPQECHMIASACAVVELCWPTIGRGCGSLFKAALWDFAGSWPILRAAGLNLRSLKTGKVLDHLNVNAFGKGNRAWKLKDHHLLSSERNYLILKNKLKYKNKK